MCWFVIRGLVDLAVGLGLFLVTWVLVSCLKVGFGWFGIGLCGDLRIALLFVDLFNWAVGLVT